MTKKAYNFDMARYANDQSNNEKLESNSKNNNFETTPYVNDQINNKNIQSNIKINDFEKESYSNHHSSDKKYRGNKKEIKQPKAPSMKGKTVPFLRLFRFMNGFDILIIILMILSSGAVGVAYPLNFLIFKNVVDILVNPIPVASYTLILTPLIIYFAILASATFLFNFIQTICIAVTSERQSKRYKHQYYSALLRQEISWFDKQQTGQLMTKITDDVESIEVAIGDRLSQFVQHILSFVGSIIIAMIFGWKLALIGCISIPLLTGSLFFMVHFIKKNAIAQIKSYAMAGGIAEEILSGMRTVVAFNGQEKEVRRYTENLSKAENYGVKKGIYQGIGSGAIGFSIFSVAALVFYMGIRFVASGEYSPGVVVQVFLTIVIGSISLGNAVPMLENFMTAKAAAYHLFEVIDRKPLIDTETPGLIPEEFTGDITFSNIEFEYPTRAGVPILKNFNFTIPNGKTVAFIGPSGSGKSTVIHLLQRFYDPVSGTVSLNNMDLKTLDLNWYRSHIGVVQQEPPLFSGTVEENIKLGKRSATMEEIIQATKDSNAYDFVMQTKEQFNTELGDMGAGFSGGQKQRIAIATALVRNPKLLLLDEATSALDNMSEKLVQNTLDHAILSGKRTVVMVAHRLQTVRNADIIVVMKNGEIMEKGNHDELLAMEGLYYEMLQAQKSKESIGEAEEMIEDDMEVAEDHLPHKVSIISDDVAISTLKPSKFQFLKDFGEIMRLNKPEASYLTLGIIGSVIVGVIFPSASLIYAEMFLVFSYSNNATLMFQHGDVFCGWMLLPALTLFVFQIIKISCMGKAGEALTTRIRSKLLEAMLRQETAWFDSPENLPGILTARLALEASQVKGIAGLQLSVFLEVIANIIASLIIGFYFNWMITFLFFIFVPFITMAGIIQGKLSSNQRVSHNEAIHSTALIMETLNNIRTVQSLGLRTHFSDQFLNSLQTGRKGKGCKLFIFGLMSAIAVSSVYYAYCVIFYVGGILLDKKLIIMINLMRVFACMTISFGAVGRALAMAPDADKARQAARNTLTTLNRVTEIDADPSVGEIPLTPLTGNIEFRNVFFRYPTRLNVSVLKGIDLTVNAGERVALVGHSGCGKSTLIQLLERYYDPLVEKNNQSGRIFLDGRDLKSLNLRWVRSQIGLVKQEPSLFNVTVAENIAYGSQEVSNPDDLVRVSKMANIHEFVSALPDGYNTKVGQRGGHLSGGQKQRICIARALYNKPAILLLDEATSALDSESEKVVQEALDRAQENCTCLVIAHRLSTIQNADKIVVIDNGSVKESGTHETLMARRKLYYELNVQHIN